MAVRRKITITEHELMELNDAERRVVEAEMRKRKIKHAYHRISR